MADAEAEPVDQAGPLITAAIRLAVATGRRDHRPEDHWAPLLNPGWQPRDVDDLARRWATALADTAHNPVARHAAAAGERRLTAVAPYTMGVYSTFVAHGVTPRYALLAAIELTRSTRRAVEHLPADVQTLIGQVVTKVTADHARGATPSDHIAALSQAAPRVVSRPSPTPTIRP